MGNYFRTSELPTGVEAIALLIADNHDQLARLRVVADANEEDNDVSRTEMRLVFARAWTPEVESRISDWLDLRKAQKLDTTYEFWVVWSLWDLMQGEQEFHPQEDHLLSQYVLPQHLRYFEEEARKALLESEQDALNFVASATEEQKQKMLLTAAKMLKNNHTAEIYSYLDEHPIVEHRSSCWLYFYIGALDFFGAQFD